MARLFVADIVACQCRDVIRVFLLLHTHTHTHNVRGAFAFSQFISQSIALFCEACHERLVTNAYT